MILPTYNERENIGLLIDELSRILDSQRDFEIIVVDDDSPDKTWKIVEEKAKKDGRIRLLRRVGKRGLTSALNDGIAIAEGEIVGWMDCDFQMDPSKISELIEVVEDGYDVAVGSRFIRGGDDFRYSKDLNHEKIVIIHKLLSRLICLVTSIVFSTTHQDWTSGFIAIRREIFKEVRLQGDYGEYFMYLMHYIIKSGYKVKEVPYVLFPRQRGTSKTSDGYVDLIAKGIGYIMAVLRLSIIKRHKNI